MSIEKNFIVNAGIEVGTSANVGASLGVGGALTVNSSISVGNATIFVSVNSTAIAVSNTTLTTSSFTTGNSTVNTSITNTRFATGNTTTNTAITATSISVGNSTVNSVITPSSISVVGTLNVQNIATFQNNVLISGNLTVQGTTTFINSNSLAIGDNIITLNADLPPSSGPTENAGIEINRGSSANVQVRWNESTDRWQLTNDGASYGDIRTSLTDITLGSETTGNYVATVAGGTGVYVTGSGTETAAVTVTIGQDVNATSSVAFAGVTVGNSSLKLNSIELATNRFIANTSGVTVTGFANVSTAVNTALFTTGVGFTANSTLTNTAALNVVNQINTATLFASTSANIGTAFTANSTLANTIALNVVNQINTATLFASTSANVGANVQANTTACLVGNSTVNTVITSTTIGGNSVALLGNTTINGDISITGNSTIGSNSADLLTINANTTLNTNTITLGSNLAIDVDTLFIDSLANEVGIGTTNPDAKLQVVGTANVSGNVTFSANATVLGLANNNGGMNTTTANASVALNVGASLQVNTTAFRVGTTVNSVITSTMIGGNSIAFLGNTIVSGDLTVTGNTQLGDAATDLVTVYANSISLISNVSIDAGTLFVDSLNNRVGIGTNAPDAPLRVVGAANVTGNAVIGGTANVTGLATLSGGMNTTTANVSVALNVGANATLSTTTLDIGNTTVNTVISSSRIGGNSIAFLGNSVISGTATVTSLANLNGGMTTTRVGGNATALLGNTSIYGNVDITGITHTISGNASFAGDTLFINDATNQVGIGTATPDAKFTVSGTANVTIDLGVGGNMSVSGSAGIGTITPNAKLQVVGTANVSGNVALAGDLSVAGNTTIGSAAGDSVTFNAAVATVTSNLSFDSGTLFIDSLNNEVGIGTTAPNAKLQVAGTANVSGNVTISANATITGLANVSGGVNTTTANASVGFNVGDSASLTTSKLDIGNSTINSTMSATTIAINRVDPATAGATVNIIADSAGYGRVELGGDIGGYIDFKTPFADSFDHRLMSNNSGFYILGGSTTSAGANLISFASQANVDFRSNTLFVDAVNNRVGIGTNAPDAPLKVGGAANVTGNAVIGGTANVLVTVNTPIVNITPSTGVGYGRLTRMLSTGGILLETSNGLDTISYIDFEAPEISTANVVYRFGRATSTTGTASLIMYAHTNSATARHWLSSNGDAYLSISAGRTGIGTDTPDATLQVVGTANVSGNTAITGDLIVRGNTTIGSSSADSITFNADVLTITSNLSIDSGTLFIDSLNNEIGIGTTNPDAKLQVVGTANVSGNVVIGGTATVTGNVAFNGTSSTINGIDIGYLNIPQNANNSSYTIVAGDSGKHIFNSTNATSLTYTIANNTNVPLAVGTAITMVNGNTATLTIAGQTGVTIQLAGTTTTGSRTLAAGGLATAIKVGTNRWFVSGAGVS